MKKSIKTILSGALAAALALTAVPSVFAEQTIKNPFEQPPSGEVCPPGIKGSDGKHHLDSLIIVAGFTDLDYDHQYDWSTTFWGDGKESLKQYYYTMSHGKFILDPAQYETSHYQQGINDNTADQDGDGVVHVRLNETHGTYVDNSKSIKETIKKAIQAADSYVDYSRYDKDNSGTIDTNEMMITVLLAGYEYSTRKKSTMTDTSKMSQAHFGRLFSPDIPTVDGKAIHFYLTGAENIKVTANGSVIQSSIEMLAHESFHYFGLPDMYSYKKDADLEWYSYRSQSHSIMSRPYGVYVDENGTPDPERYSIYSLDPWSKIRLGWANYTVVKPEGDDQTVTKTIDALDYNNIEQKQETFLRINTSDQKQYFLIENRRFKGYDAGMRYDPKFIDNNSGGGIIIWHIDESILNGDDNNPNYLQTMVINDSDHRPAIMPVFIENNNNLEENNYTFFGNSVNFRTGIHSAESLASYGLSKIDLVIYNYHKNCTGVNDRRYANISVTPSASADSMSVTINFDDDVHPVKMKQIYLEKTDAVFSERQNGQAVGDHVYLFAYDDSDDDYYGYRNWPGVKMERVKDNIYVANVPESFTCFIFNDGEPIAAESRELQHIGSNILYTTNGWTTYQKQLYPGQLRGDVNLDQCVNIKDVTALQRHLAQLDIACRLQLALSDTDNNGRINITDATVIQQYLAEMLNFDHPCGQTTDNVYV